jgi:hypothetical protein
MLFVVLFYVYPLKFLFNLSITRQFFGGGPPVSITSPQLSTLLVIYGLGFAAVYGAMTLLYLHAWRLRDALELNELEKFDTRYVMFRLLTLVVFGLIATVLAYIPVVRNWSALFYLLLFPILRASGVIHRRRRARYITAT